MSFTKTLHSLGVGDIIQTRRTLRVTDAFANGVQLEDVATGEEFACADRDHGTLQLSVVQKAAPEVKPVKVGDKIEGAEAYASLPVGAVFVGLDFVNVVDRDGEVHSVDITGETHFKGVSNIDSFSSPRTVVYLP